MKREILMRKIIFGLILFFLISANAERVQALILPYLTMEEMITRADTIVTGRSERFHLHPGAEGKALHAIITFKVEEYLKNDLGEDEIIIMQVAQERGADGKFVAGPFALKMDEEVILFLTEEDPQGFRHVFGLSQGKLAVTKDWLGREGLLQEMKGVKLFNKETGEIRDAKTIRIKLSFEEFKILVYQITARIKAEKATFAASRPNTYF